MLECTLWHHLCYIYTHTHTQRRTSRILTPTHFQLSAAAKVPYDLFALKQRRQRSSSSCCILFSAKITHICVGERSSLMCAGVCAYVRQCVSVLCTAWNIHGLDAPWPVLFLFILLFTWPSFTLSSPAKCLDFKKFFPFAYEIFSGLRARITGHMQPALGTLMPARAE